MGPVERFLNVLLDPAAGGDLVAGVPGPVPDRLDLFWSGGDGLDRSLGRGVGAVRQGRGGGVQVFGEIVPQPGQVVSGQVDLVVGLVQAEPDGADVLGGAVEVVNENGDG